MNATLESLMHRHSVRNYAERPILPAEREAIFSAALRAPTAGNLMLYSIIEISDSALKDRLAETCDHQPFIAKAPLLLAFLADYQRWYDIFRADGVAEMCRAQGSVMRAPQEGDLFLAACDTLIAAQTAVIAAESLGIGSCYIGDFMENYEIHRELLHLPPYVLPVTLICFGYPPHETGPRRLTTRFDPAFIIHQNTYRRLDPQQQAAMLAERNANLPERVRQEGIQNAGQSMYFRKYNTDFMLEMNRSVHVMLESWIKGEQED